MLDIHIGESKDIAAKRTPRCQFDETTHVKIFVTANFARTSYPKLSKLEDYYADASFSHEELLLAAEID